MTDVLQSSSSPFALGKFSIQVEVTQVMGKCILFSSRIGTRPEGGLTVPSCIKYVHYFVHSFIRSIGMCRM
jgi:hypothetical protein